MVREADPESRRLNSPIKEIAKLLGSLPYADMKQLAKEIEHQRVTMKAKLGDNDSDLVMAEALLEVSKQPLIAADTTQEDSRVLAKIFSRKRQISVDRISTGWKVAIPTLGVSALGIDLRATLADLLDQAVVSRILLGDKK